MVALKAPYVPHVLSCTVSNYIKEGQWESLEQKASAFAPGVIISLAQPNVSAKSPSGISGVYGMVYTTM